MSKIKIITDSPADIPQELVKEYDMGFLPVSIYFGDKEYRDYLDITPEEFYERLKGSDEIPTTSQVRVTDFEEKFREAIEGGYDTVICFTLSKESSGTFNNANIAKNMVLEDHPDADITVVSGALSYVYGRVALKAAEMAKDGKSKEEILNEADRLFNSYGVFFVVENLKYLKKGGRINPAVAQIGDILNIKPILSLQDGLVSAVEKVRGSKKVIPKIMELLKAEGIEEAKEVYVLVGDADETAIANVKEALNENFGITETVMRTVGAVIGVNTGPGVYAVLFYK